jgi:hypothetical protein
MASKKLQDAFVALIHSQTRFNRSRHSRSYTERPWRSLTSEPPASAVFSAAIASVTALCDLPRRLARRGRSTALPSPPPRWTSTGPFTPAARRAGGVSMLARSRLGTGAGEQCASASARRVPPPAAAETAGRL